MKSPGAVQCWGFLLQNRFRQKAVSFVDTFRDYKDGLLRLRFTMTPIFTLRWMAKLLRCTTLYLQGQNVRLIVQ
jgi:hypothetical protein